MNEAKEGFAGVVIGKSNTEQDIQGLGSAWHRRERRRERSWLDLPDDAIY